MKVPSPIFHPSCSRFSNQLRSAFSLAEVLIGTVVTTAVLTGLITGTVALTKSYKASEYYMEATNDQVRALDYIVRDTRGALTAVVSTDGNTLTLTVPAFYSSYDAQGNPNGAPVSPTVVNKVASYGDATKPNTIQYYVSGSSLIRKFVVGATNASSTSVIGDNVDNFDFTFSSLDSTITTSLSFSPRFRGIGTATDLQTTRSAVVYLRNHS